MASAAQVVANRSNAQKSTGPRTPEGKAVVAQNAVQHGLLAQEVVIRGEDPGEFEFYRDQMLGELAPVGQIEAMLAARVVSLSWRLQRAERLQGAAFDAMYEKLTAEPVIKLPALLGYKRADRPAGEAGRGDAELTLGRVVVRDYSNARVLDRLLMYERRIESSLYRTMGELQKQQRMREMELATGGVTADGAVTGNSERVRDQCPPWSEEVGRGRPTYEEPPEGGTPNESCETNPICTGSNTGQVPCGAEVRNDLPQDEVCETNPIPWDQAIAVGTRPRTMEAVVGACVDP